jgi:hypothetical protein
MGNEQTEISFPTLEQHRFVIAMCCLKHDDFEIDDEEFATQLACNGITETKPISRWLALKKKLKGTARPRPGIKKPHSNDAANTLACAAQVSDCNSASSSNSSTPLLLNENSIMLESTTQIVPPQAPVTSRPSKRSLPKAEHDIELLFLTLRHNKAPLQPDFTAMSKQLGLNKGSMYV